MPKMAVRTEIVLVLVAAGIVLVACSGSSGNGTGVLGGPCPSKTPAVPEIEGDMTINELVDLVAEAITCPGYAFHMRSVGDQEAGPYSAHTESEVWVDIENNLGRIEIRSRFTSEEALAEAEEDGYDPEWRSTGIVRDDGSYSSEEVERPSRKGRPPTCHGFGREALGLVFQCYDGPLQDIEISIDVDASYGSHSAFAYVAEGESSGSDETYDTITRTYFDSDTLLPTGQTVEGTLDIGEIHAVRTDIEYEHEYVRLDSLPEDFFDPASIGYVEPDPEDVEKPLDDAEIAVYWLGREFAGEGDLPSLAIRHANVRPDAQTPEGGYIAEIVYRPADDEFGHYLVRIDLLTPAAWEYREERTLHSPCEETRKLDVDGHEGTVKIHHWGSSQDRDGACLPPDRYSAVVHFDDVVVDIDAPATGGGGETFYSPYDSEEGIEMLLRGLELRE